MNQSFINLLLNYFENLYLDSFVGYNLQIIFKKDKVIHYN